MGTSWISRKGGGLIWKGGVWTPLPTMDEELLEVEEQYLGDEDRNSWFREIVFICQEKMVKNMAETYIFSNCSHIW